MTFDLLVAGGGPAGCAAAIAATAAGRKVVVVDAGRRALPAIERLAPRASALLDQLGLLTEVDACGARSCPGIRSLWGGSENVNRAIFDPHGAGWVVERARFDAWLRSAAVARGVDLLSGGVAGIARDGDVWRVQVDGDCAPSVLQASALIVATGRSRRLLRNLRVETRTHGAEVALLARIEVRGLAWIDDPLLLVEAVGRRWAYGILAEGVAAVVGFSAGPDEVARGELETAWRHAWSESRLIRRLAGGEQPASLWAQPSHITDASCAAGPAWAAVGDAACGHGPLSGQGLSFALESGMAAARALIQERDGGDGYRTWAARYVEDYLRMSRAFAL